MRMRFDVDDEDEFFATSEQLVTQFESWLAERGQPLDLVSDADLMLNWKWGYADGDLAWWRIGHLDELLLEWYPRKVSAPPDLVEATLPSVAAFLTFLDDQGLLSSASDSIEQLQQHVNGMTEAFAAAMADNSKFGMAKSMFGSVTPDIDFDDPSSLQRAMEAFNALPFDERDRILTGPMADLAGRSGLAREFRPVVLLEPEARAAAAAGAVWYRRIIAFVDWVADGQPLTKGSNNITLAGARELIEILAADEQMDAQVGGRAYKTQSSTELPTVDLAYRWARAAGLVKVRKGRLTRTARGETVHNDDPAEVVRQLTWTLVNKVGMAAHRWRNAGPYSWDWHARTVDAMVGEWLLMLYDVEVADIDELAGEAWDQLEYEFDLSRVPASMLEMRREGVASEVLHTFRMLESLGLVTITNVRVDEHEYPTGYVDRRESGGTVTIAPLGIWVVHDRASALGQTTVVGELAEVDAATLLERVLDLPDQIAGPEVDAWLAARTPEQAVSALATALQSASDSALGVGVKALLNLPDAAAEPVAAMLGHPRLGPYARVWQVDAQSVDVNDARTEDPALQARVVAAAMDLWGDSAPSRWVELVVGTDDVATLADAVAAWWNVDGDPITEVLQLLGLDDRKPLAKAARKANFKRRSAS